LLLTCIYYRIYIRVQGISKDDALTYLSLTDAKLYIFFDLANYFIKKAEKCCHFNKNNEKMRESFPDSRIFFYLNGGGDTVFQISGDVDVATPVRILP
jgi:hypothetical protein